MSKTHKPKVITKCVANNYALPNERIIEYTFGPDGNGGSIGGLIRFLQTDEGRYIVLLYRHDPNLQNFGFCPGNSKTSDTPKSTLSSSR